jgi:hypothetical protein
MTGPEPPDMDVTEWPIYITDTYHVECHKPGCEDEEFPHPGRRVTVAEFLDAVIEHARTEHGLTIERTWGFR